MENSQQTGFFVYLWKHSLTSVLFHWLILELDGAHIFKVTKARTHCEMFLSKQRRVILFTRSFWTYFYVVYCNMTVVDFYKTDFSVVSHLFRAVVASILFNTNAFLISFVQLCRPSGLHNSRDEGCERGSDWWHASPPGSASGSSSRLQTCQSHGVCWLEMISTRVRKHCNDLNLKVQFQSSCNRADEAPPLCVHYWDIKCSQTFPCKWTVMLEPWCALCLLCFWPSGMYPMDQSEYPGLRSAIERLTLNDSSVTVQRDSSLALGAGWRWGPNRLAQQTSTYALVTNQKKNAKVLLNQSRLSGAWLFAVRLKNADEAAKWSISPFIFFPQTRAVLERTAQKEFIILCQPRWWK